MLHEAIFLATCSATMTNKKPFKLQRGCYTQATCLETLRKVEGHSAFLASRNATSAVAKWGVTREFCLATCNAMFVALQVARKIASCNMAFSEVQFIVSRAYPSSEQSEGLKLINNQVFHLPDSAQQFLWKLMPFSRMLLLCILQLQR